MISFIRSCDGRDRRSLARGAEQRLCRLQQTKDNDQPPTSGRGKIAVELRELIDTGRTKTVLKGGPTPVVQPLGRVRRTLPGRRRRTVRSPCPRCACSVGMTGRPPRCGGLRPGAARVEGVSPLSSAAEPVFTRRRESCVELSDFCGIVSPTVQDSFTRTQLLHIRSPQ